MLNPNSLRSKSNAVERERRLKEKRIREEEIRVRKKTEEAQLRREEDARQREKERLLKEEELKQQKAARLLREEERRVQLEAQLKEENEFICEVVGKAINHAIQNNIYTRSYYGIDIYVHKLNFSRFRRCLSDLGFECVDLPALDVRVGAVEKIISGLARKHKDRNYKRENIHKQALAEAISKDLDENDFIVDLVRQIREDKNITLDSKTDFSVNSFLAEFDSETRCILVKWKSADTLEVVFDELHQVPSWIVSTSGAGLMKRIDDFMGADAALGRRSSNFALTFLSINAERWGRNRMTQFKYNEEPIGVCPFPLDVILLIFKAIGFDASVKNKYVSPILSIAW